LGYVENYNADRVPGVKSSIRLTPAGKDEQYPLLTKVYDTPKGQLRQVVKITTDWPHGQDIPLFSDFNVPRQVEAIIKDVADIPRLQYLLNDPDVEQVHEYRQQARFLRQQADRLGVALEGGWVALGDAMIWLLGMERVLYGQMDEPELLEQLLDVLLEWELKRVDFLIEEGIDFLTHMAWYEGTDFWTPRNYRRMLKPRLVKLVEKAHAHDIKFHYIITRGWKPLRQDFLEMGIDCIAGDDPIQDNVVLEQVKHEVGDRICLMGGVNSSVMLTQWSEDQIRQAVRDAIRILSPGGGFILYPVDQIFDEMDWHKVQVLIDEWRASWPD
jgi:uroporphyrinogen-III decarboxylase